MTTKPKTALSAGLALHHLLSKAFTSKTVKIFPGISAEAKLPYISYQRRGLASVPTKISESALAAEIEVRCYASSYGASIDLAETVRAALEGTRGIISSGAAEGIAVRGISLIDASEEEEGEAWVQTLVFTVRI